MSCGWAIASQRRARYLNALKDQWIWRVDHLFQRDKSNGFSGTFDDWKTAERLELITKSDGCPFTKRQLVAMGWNIQRPMTKSQRAAVLLIVQALGGVTNTRLSYHGIHIFWNYEPLAPNKPDPEYAQAIRKKHKIDPLIVSQIEKNLLSDIEFYALNQIQGPMFYAQNDLRKVVRRNPLPFHNPPKSH